MFNIVRQAVMSKKKWDVEEFLYIGVFSFRQFVMWNDIKNRAEDLKKNKVVASLIKGDLTREVAKTFGFVKVNGTIEKAVKNGIEEAERKNHISVAEDGERIVVGE